MSHKAPPILRFLAVALMALAAGCASTPRGSGIPGGSPHYKVGKSYQVNGRWYHPEEDPEYSRVGVASWYGPQFHGRMTANGEIFDMNLLSAAHPTLPLPSMVEVTNLENGKSLVVRLNDRGPFARDRIIDMSREAARHLGFEQQGTARVRVRYLAPAPLMAKAPGTASRPERVARAAPVREAALRQTPPQAQPAAPQPDEISTLLTSMESAPALTQGAEDVAVAQAEDAEIPAADLSTADPDDSILVHQGVSAEQAPEAIYVIRVAALSKLDQIDALRAQLGDVGALRLSRVETEVGNVFYRVNLGPFASIETAAEKLAAVRGAGYADASLVTLTP